MAWTLFNTFLTLDKLTDLVQTKSSKFKNKGCETPSFLLISLHYQIAKDLAGVDGWEGGDTKAHKLNLFISLNKFEPKKIKKDRHNGRYSLKDDITIISHKRGVMASINLFADVDKTATKKKAIKVLRRYRMLTRIAGLEYAPKVTASFSLEPKSFDGMVHSQTESIVTRKVAAEQDLQAIVRAINALSDRHYSQILIECYCRNRKQYNIEVYMDLGYSESEYYRMREQAILEFAENYRNGECLVFLGD